MGEEKLKKCVDVGGSGILANLDATAIAAAIKNKDFTIKEAVDCVADRIGHTEPSLNALVTSNFNPNLSSVSSEGVFGGVPIFIKDLVKVKGFPTLQGSRGIPEIIATKNEKVMDHIAATGGIAFGKSTMR